MSDHTLPPYTPAPFAPPPYDNSGQPWLPGSDGNWVGSQQQPPPQYSSVPGTSATTAQAPFYNFPPPTQTSAGPSHAHAVPGCLPLIDPRLLPPQADHDVLDPATVARSRGLVPAKKVAGVRRSDSKGKKRRHYSSGSDSEEEPVAKRGRRKGTPNFSRDDVTNLLDRVDKCLPLGAKGWKVVAAEYAKQARKMNRPERDVKSLEAKYKQLLKTKKPTGNGQRPPEITRAHEIEAKINNRADTRELSDFDSDDGADGSDDSIEILDRSARAPTPPLPPRRNTRMNAPELVNKLSQAFDPDTLRARDEERGQRSFQTTQIFMMSQQIRDAQVTIESLRTQITTMQANIHNAERARDRAEMALSWYQDGARKQRRRSGSSRYDGLVRVGGKVRNERKYPDGGACTTWDTAPSSDESDKENKDPSSSSSHMSFATRSPSPFDLHRSVSYPPRDAQGSDNNAASGSSTGAGGAN
ncbi:hypothetical protein DFH06DRAFT_1128088 [Mycena polygramma]|nr:hypothetical protein DFH06DRAFT_1128088 [Mycena polygramma]